jgi:hypothetical protein
MKKIPLPSLSLMLLCLLAFHSSCKRKTITPKRQLHLHADMDSNEIDLGGAYANADGRNIAFQ